MLPAQPGLPLRATGRAAPLPLPPPRPRPPRAARRHGQRRGAHAPGRLEACGPAVAALQRGTRRAGAGCAGGGAGGRQHAALKRAQGKAASVWPCSAQPQPSPAPDLLSSTPCLPARACRRCGMTPWATRRLGTSMPGDPARSPGFQKCTVRSYGNEGGVFVGGGVGVGPL